MYCGRGCWQVKHPKTNTLEIYSIIDILTTTNMKPFVQKGTFLQQNNYDSLCACLGLCWLLGVSVPHLIVENGSIHSSPSSSIDQARALRFPTCPTHLLSSRLYCLLGWSKTGKKLLEFPTLFFRKGVSFANVAHKIAIASSQVYCCSTVVGLK